MKRMALLTLLCAFAARCITTVDVQKVDPGTNPAGVRYFLPAPFLKVTPAVDGSVTVEILYLPDPNREYAVDARSVMAKHKLAMTLADNQLLKKIEWNGQSADVAKQVIESASNVLKEKITARAAAEKEAAEAAKKEADAQAAALAAAEKALADAELKLRIATDKGTFLRDNGGTPEARLAAELAVLEARAQRDEAARVLADLQSKSSALKALMDKPENEAPGPMLFRIVDTGKAAKLVPAAPQTDFPTSTAQPVMPPARMKLFIKGNSVLMPATNGSISFVVVSSVALESVTPSTVVNTNTNTDAGFSSVATLNSTTEFTVALPNVTPAGKYKVNFGIKPVGDKKMPLGVDIEVRR